MTLTSILILSLLVLVGLAIPPLLKYIEKRKLNSVNIILSEPDAPPEKFDEAGYPIRRYEGEAKKKRKPPNFSVPPMWSWRKALELIVSDPKRSEMVCVDSGKEYTRLKREITRYDLAHYVTKEGGGYYYVSISKSEREVDNRTRWFNDKVKGYSTNSNDKKKGKKEMRGVFEAMKEGNVFKYEAYPSASGASAGGTTKANRDYNYDIPKESNWKDDIVAFQVGEHDSQSFIIFVEGSTSVREVMDYAEQFGPTLRIALTDSMTVNDLHPTAVSKTQDGLAAMRRLYEERGRTNRGFLGGKRSNAPQEESPY